MSEPAVPPDPAPEPAQPEPAPARLVLERVQGCTLQGWAFDPATPGAEKLTLLCGAEPVPADVRRTSRADVRRALGTEEVLLGFEIDLPVAIWQALAAARGELQLFVNGQALAHAALRPTLAGLMEWMDRIGQQAAPEEREALLAPLRAHLQAARHWQAALGDPGLEASTLHGPAPGHVEGWRGLCLRGWVADSPTQRVPIRLQVGGRLLDGEVRRSSRQDVAQTLMLSDEMIGFELEVPGSVWDDTAGQAELDLQLVVDGAACGEPWALRRDELSDRLDAALALTDPADREHQSLLALEHLVHADALDTLDEALSRALRGLAQATGTEAALARPGQPAPRSSQPQRQPMRLKPRGRMGAWLQSPDHAARALRWLMSLRQRPALATLAERVEVMLTLALGWFDKALYDDQMPAAERGGLSALRHYVRHGDALSLVPMLLFDPRHYVGQLPGRRHPGINRLLHHGLWGRFHGLTTSLWFDAGHYLAHNPDVATSGQDPWLHFLNFGWQENRRPHPDVLPLQASGGPLLQRLRREQHVRHADPRVDFFLQGLPAAVERPDDGRLPWMPPTRLDGRDHTLLGAWRGLPVPDPSRAQVSIIVPVYAGVQETLRCLWSVLDADTEVPFELVVIDDCSPDPALSAFLRELAGLGLIRLLVNAENQGFVATANLGLSLHWDRDVVLLNADTRVHPGWLDRLVAHGRAEPRAASITPLSNHATICSYPQMPRGNPPPHDPDDAELDRLAALANPGRHVSAPTGVGFCMWMRRAALDQVGLLDTQRFGRGYGEENDWCLRASAAGWQHLLAADVFVLHQGSVSFSGETSPRVRAAMATLAERHPHYAAEVDAWIAADPLRPARARLDAARLREHVGTRVVLMISHARGGGTARHEREQAHRLHQEQGLGTLFLRPSRQSGCVSLCAADGAPLANLDGLPAEPDGLLAELLAMFELVQVQLHHLIDHPASLREHLPGLCRRLGVPLSITVHDYHAICPRTNLVDASGRYCGEPDAAGCRRCLQRDGLLRSSGGIQPWRAAHRQLLQAADEVIVPDVDVLQRLRRYVPGLAAEVRPHEPMPAAPTAEPLGQQPPQRVLVIGALGQIKGYEVLLALARSEGAHRGGLRFTLLGHSQDDETLRQAGVAVLGRYEDAALARRIDELAPDLILLPSVWPETYSYVLTAAMASGRRIAAFDLGAPAQRLRAWDPAGRRWQLWPLAEAVHPERLVLRMLAQH